jgi:F420-dependent oxidoreductase-like protein
MELRLPAPSLVVLVGPSGSGKSTWAAEHFAPSEIVSSDKLRGVVGAGEDDQTASTVAFQLLEIIVAERLKRGLTTVIDTLGFDDDARLRWIESSHEAGIPAHAVVFDTPDEVCRERNTSRARPIPKGVLERQFSRFRSVTPKVAEEPFDGVHDVAPVAAVTPAVARAVTTPSTTRQSSTHTFGLIVSRFDWGDVDMGASLMSIARRAEEAGFRDLWLMDHFRQIRGVGRPWENIPEVYVSLGLIAGVTSTIRLGALVGGVTHRHPVVLGKMVASLDVLSGGRAICGLGVAWDAKEHAAYGIDFPDVSTRYELLEETLQMLPLLWGKGSPQFHGRHIHADELICYPRPIQNPIPIMIGGSGERRTLRLVARYGDMCNLFGDPATLTSKVEVLMGHCADLDRDPDEIEITHLADVLAAPGRRDLRARVEELRDRNTTAEEYMSRFNAGTVDDLVALFNSYHEAGAGHSIVSMPDVHREGSIETFAEVIASFSPS